MDSSSYALNLTFLLPNNLRPDNFIASLSPMMLNYLVAAIVAISEEIEAGAPTPKESPEARETVSKEMATNVDWLSKLQYVPPTEEKLDNYHDE